MQNKYQISDTKSARDVYVLIQIIFDLLKSLSVKLTHTFKKLEWIISRIFY